MRTCGTWVLVAVALAAGIPISSAAALPIAPGACTLTYEVYISRGRSRPWVHDEQAAAPERVAAYWERAGDITSMSHPVWYKYVSIGEDDPCAANPYRWLKEAMKWGDVVIPLPRSWHWGLNPATWTHEWILDERWEYVVFALGMPADAIERLLSGLGGPGGLEVGQTEKLITIFRQRYPLLVEAGGLAE